MAGAGAKPLDLIPERLEELLGWRPCQGPYQSSPISGEPSGCQSSNPRVIHTKIGGAPQPQRIGLKPASNSDMSPAAGKVDPVRHPSDEMATDYLPDVFPADKTPRCRGSRMVRRGRAPPTQKCGFLQSGHNAR